MIIKKELNYNIVSNNRSEQKKIILHIQDNLTNSMHVIHRAAIKQLTQKRHGNASTKTRSEIRGGGKKPWKQKGTGKARAGSIRSPLWKGGGVIFGPKSKRYIKKINKKENQLALRTIIANKFRNTIITDNFVKPLEVPSTQMILKIIKDLGLNIKKQNKILIITDKKDINLFLSIRNLKNINLIAADQINIISLLGADKLIITTNGLNKIEKIYNG